MKKNYFIQKILKTFCFTLLLMLTQISNSQNVTYNIEDPEDIQNVIYQPGDIIILKNGTYSTNARKNFLGTGTAENPVTFRAETPGGVIFTGGFKMNIGGETEGGSKIATGEYLIVEGFYWKGGFGASNFIQFRNGSDYAHHSSIQNCVIDGLGVAANELADDLANEQITKHRWIVLYGTYNTVINCSFMNKVTAGAIILGEYSYNAFPEGDDGPNNSCTEVGHTISNNYFYNFEKLTELYGKKANGDDLSNAGDSETIRIGTSSYQMVNSNATISNNYFVQSDGENEIITNKSKGNTYTNNTFRRCRGSLVLRHGSNATLQGNFFLGENVDGTGGIRISDSNHLITNNYIQDCITVQSYAKWNNGITFIGGGANADADCNSDNVSNGYQKTENITVINNTIINTNAPLFYNVNTDNNSDVKGTVSDNLIYFASNNSNLTDVISGDTGTSFATIGETLTYTGNVFTGTELGITNAGFTKEIGISATEDGEIFTFSGTGSEGKGAEIGSKTPYKDGDVGNDGVGACYVDFEGNPILTPTCNSIVIIPAESLNLTALTTFNAESSSKEVTVSANVDWTVTDDSDWISVSPATGNNNGAFNVSVTTNTEFTERTGKVTVYGGDLTRFLNITQAAADPKDSFQLINDQSVNDKVIVHSAFAEEVTATKNNIKEHSLDKDFNTQWSGFGVPGEIIFDLGGAYDLALVDFATTGGKTYELQIWVSTTDAESGSFTNAFTNVNLVSNSDGSFKSFILPAVAVATKFVKVIGYGQPARPSDWNTIKEIEFYQTNPLSINNSIFEDEISLYPNPTSSIINIKADNVEIEKIQLYNVNGRIVLDFNNQAKKSDIKVDVSKLAKGSYFVVLSTNSGLKTSKTIIIK